jgi:hypothetical protein
MGCRCVQWPGINRNLFLCCVRMSPEKQPQTFVAIAAELSQRGVFKRLELQPLLVAASTSAYAQEMVREFEEKVPEGQVERKFMTAQELAEVFARTVLNFHPCEYDAYGMTVVEAASQGAPSVMHEVQFRMSCMRLSGNKDKHVALLRHRATLGHKLVIICCMGVCFFIFSYLIH